MQKLLTVYICGGLLAATAFGQTNNETKSEVATAPLTGLKEAYAGKFLIGTAGDVPRGYSEAEMANIKASYNIITPEN
jgi:hypothetical protein